MPALRGGQARQTASSRDSSEEVGLNYWQLAGAALFLCSGVGLQVAWQRRLHVSMQTSQLVCIFAAIWVYVLLCYGVPATYQLLAQSVRAVVGQVAVKEEEQVPGSATAGTGIRSLATNVVQGGAAADEAKPVDMDGQGSLQVPAIS